MSRNQPYIPIYKGDFLRSNVAVCSIAAQGLWLRMMFLLHDSERRGYLTLNGSPMPPVIAAKKCSVTVDEYELLLDELSNVGAFSTSTDGIIFAPEIVSENDKKEQNAKRQKDFRERRKREKEAEKLKTDAEKRNAEVTLDVTPEKHAISISSSSSSSIANEEKDKSIDLSQKKKIGKKSAKKEIPFPEVFELTNEQIDWAKKKTPGISISLTTDKFINHVRLKALTSSDWNLSWQKYLLTAQEYFEQSQKRPPPLKPENIPKVPGGENQTDPPTDEKFAFDENGKRILDERQMTEIIDDFFEMIGGGAVLETLDIFANAYTVADWQTILGKLKKRLEEKPDETDFG